MSEQAVVQALSAVYAREGMAPLSGCTPEGLARETLAKAAQWNFLAKVDSIKDRPALIVTSDDGLPQGANFAIALGAAGDSRVTTLHLHSDHAYSDQRSALSSAILEWLAGLP